MFNIRPFQVILIGAFAAFAVFGLIFLSVFQRQGGEEAAGYGDSVTIWGTLDSQSFYDTFSEIVKTDKAFQVVEYVEKDPRSFDLDLLTAIAEGRSPDLIVLKSDSIVTHREKLRAVSFETLSERSYRDTYIDGAEIFLLKDGIYALPFAVDPLVMYWNRDIFSGNGLATPPKTWEEIVSVVEPAITEVDQSFGITRSALAFGEYANIRNAKHILSLLFLQAGTDIVDESNTGYTITLNEAGNGGIPPADASLAFYTQFANPSGSEYTWNRAMREDRQVFTAGGLALYFGLGSEYYAIDAANPNLNFDITQVPQGSGASIKRGFGLLYGFAIPRASGNPQGAWKAAQVLGRQANSALLAERLDLAPVHRGELSSGSQDPYRATLYTAALIARGWLDPNSAASDNVFKTMVEDITSGRVRISEAIADAIGRLRLLF